MLPQVNILMEIKNKIGKIFNHQGFRRYALNTIWMFFEQILRFIAGLLVGIWIARYLGPEKFGIFSYTLAFTSIFAGIAKLGLDGILVRDLVKEPEKRDVYLGTAFWLKLIGAILTLGIIVTATLFTSNDAVTNLYIFIIAGGIIFQSFEVVDFYFQSKVLSKFVSICRMIQFFLSSLLNIYFVISRADLFWFVLVSLIDQITLAVSLYLSYSLKGLPSFFRYFDWNVGKRLLKNSYPLIFSSFVLMLQARIDQIMLKEMIGNIEVGCYSVAMRFIEVFGFIPMILTNSLFPAIVNARKISKEFYENRLLNFYRLMMVLFLIVAIPIFIFGNKVVLLLYGNAYAPAGFLFSLMAIRLFFTNYGVARGAFLLTENLMSYSLITMVIGTIVNIILNYLWIPDYKSVGAIWASVISFFIVTFFLDVFYNVTRKNFFLMLRSMFLVKDIKGILKWE